MSSFWCMSLTTHPGIRRRTNVGKSGVNLSLLALPCSRISLVKDGKPFTFFKEVTTSLTQTNIFEFDILSDFSELNEPSVDHKVDRLWLRGNEWEISPRTSYRKYLATNYYRHYLSMVLFSRDTSYSKYWGWGPLYTTNQVPWPWKSEGPSKPSKSHTIHFFELVGLQP